MRPGEQVGPFEIVRELGRGGMGVVYLARDSRVDRQVALKALTGPWLDATLVERLFVEAQAIARLRHRGIVTVHELCADNGRPYLVLDYVEGESLKERLSRGPLDPEEAARMTLAVTSALHHAHERSILHRDIKPANVLLDPEWGPVLTDFGIAKDLSDSRERLTRTGELLGTPEYMAPEQARGEAHAIGPRTDVYGLGATLYAMLTGRAPFSDTSVLALLGRITRDAPIPPRRLNPSVPAALEEICLRSLAKDPEDRYASAAALGDALDAFLAGTPPRTSAPRKAAVVIAAGAVVACATTALWALGPLAPPPTGDVSAVRTRTRAAVPPPLTPKQQRAGERAFRALKRKAPSEQAREAAAWLTAFPSHPLGDEVRALRASALQSIPLFPRYSTGNTPWVHFMGRDVLAYWHTQQSSVWIKRVGPRGLEPVAQVRFSGEIEAATTLGTGLLVAAGARTHLLAPDGSKTVHWRRTYGAGPMAVSRDQKLVAVIDNIALPRVLRIIESSTEKLAFEHGLAMPEVRGVAFGVGRSRLAVVAGTRFKNAEPVNARLLLFEVDPDGGARKLVDTALSADPGFVAWRPEGDQFAVGIATGRLLFFDGKTGTQVGEFKTKARMGGLRVMQPVAMGFSIREGLMTSSPRRLFLISGGERGSSDGALGVFDLDSGKRLRHLKRGQTSVSMALSSDERFLAIGLQHAGTKDGGLEVWDARSQ